MCKEFGEISSVKAIIDKNTGECKGRHCGVVLCLLAAHMCAPLF